jgi:dTDP-4-amino-4,6-dideoxygalactose transaminase
MLNYNTLFEFEAALAEYTGAPYVVVTDGCSHSIELCLLYDRVTQCKITPFTYLSVPMTLHKVGVQFEYLNEEQQTWIGEYQLIGTRIWDSARRLERGMYRPGQMQCLSFGNGKPMQLGKVGCILTDDAEAYRVISMMRSDGRDLRINPWINQTQMQVGYHYFPTLESVAQGLEQLATLDKVPTRVDYPDCRKINIVGSAR